MQEFTARRSTQYPVPLPEQPRIEHREAPASGTRRRNRLLGFACAAVAVVSLLASDGLLRAAALVSAGLALPQGADTLFYPANEALGEVTQMALAGTPTQKVILADTKNFDLKATPKDIEVLMEEAFSEFAGQKRDGGIRAKTYTAKDATHAWGRLTARNATRTQAGRDLSKDLAAPIGLEIDKQNPAILIFHTHTTEGFEIIDRPWYAADWSSRTENGAKSIVRIGAEMAKVLERAGWQVIHDTNIYDRQYTGAYDKSRAAVLKHLEENPGILVTLDVHRDAIHTDKGVRIKPVAQIGGKAAAQVMIITGVREGAISGYADWEENLRFAAKLHVAAEERYPGLMRPLFFAPRKYNMDVTPYSLLLEMGADVNTLEEAVYSGRLIGDVLAGLLEGYVV